MSEYFKTYHLFQYWVLVVVLWCMLDVYGSFTVGRVHVHQVRAKEQAVKVERRRQNELNRKQAQMRHQVPVLLKQVHSLQTQAKQLNQQTKHEILPSDVEYHQEETILNQVKCLQSKVANIDTNIVGAKRLRVEYHQLVQTADDYGF